MPAEVTKIHGLTAEHVSAAPTFGELAPWLERVFAGRVAVAHNASFDVPFINREFGRVGAAFRITAFACTKVAAGGGRLTEVAARFEVALEDAHQALNDSRATLEIARRIGANNLMEQVGDAVSEATLDAAKPPRTLSRFQLGIVDEIPGVASDFLAKLADENSSANRYLAYLNETFKDLVISDTEWTRLGEVARDARLTVEEADALNRRFLSELESAALRDRIVTELEMSVIAAFARQVGLVPSVTVSEVGNSAQIVPGTLICVTGEPVIDGRVVKRVEVSSHIEAAGFVYTDKLGKTQGVGLLLVESYGSQSTKARNAVLWGIPVLSITDFLLNYAK
jgi:DNA polymerase-3 subunit epsilon